MLRLNLYKSSHFVLWNNKAYTNDDELQKKISDLGFRLDMDTGHLFYHHPFRPMHLNFELVFIRHGETYGNCGQSSQEGKIDFAVVDKELKNKDHRIYQGNVDTEINQLTQDGKQQAFELAIKLKTELIENGWIPDVVFVSPLSRAIETALPFLEQNNLLERCIEHKGIREMSFGSWENRRVCDFPPQDICHQFYLEQNALVKKSGMDCNGIQREAENFAEVLLRAYHVLLHLNDQYRGKKIIMFSHSMFGAACCFLLNHGQKIENSNYLAFDGKRSDGSSYTMPHASPFFLNGINPSHALSHKRG